MRKAAVVVSSLTILLSGCILTMYPAAAFADCTIHTATWTAAGAERFGDTSTHKMAQTFTTTCAGNLTGVKAVLRKFNDGGEPADDMLIDIYDTTSGLPTGSSIGTITYHPGSDLTTSCVETTMPASSIALTDGHLYAAVFSRSGSENADTHYGICNTSGYSDGQSLYNNGTWHVNGTVDHDITFTITSGGGGGGGGGEATTTEATSTTSEIAATTGLFSAAWLVFLATMVTAIWIYRVLA